MFGGSRKRVAWLLAVAILPAVLAVAGCGDDGDSTANDEPRFSAAGEPPNVFVKRLAKLLETTTEKVDCPQLEQINLRSFVRFPCPPEKSLRKSMASFKVVGTQEYGTGAVVDYKSGTVKQGGTILLFVAPDRNWGISRMGILTDPSTGTSDDDSREGFATAADEFVEATRKKDCKKLEDVAFVADLEGKKDCKKLEDVAFVADLEGKDVCKQILGRFTDFARQVQSHPDAEAVYVGGNDTYGFLNVETEKPDENTTISVVKGTGDDPYLVMDAGPSPTSLQQREVREQAERQQREERRKKREQERKQQKQQRDQTDSGS